MLRPRFSLRTLLLFTLLSGSVMSVCMRRPTFEKSATIDFRGIVSDEFEYEPWQLEFAAGNRVIAASTDWNCKLAVWTPSVTNREEYSLEHRLKIYHPDGNKIAISPDGHDLVYCAGRALERLNLLTTESEFIHANFCDSSSADFARDKDGRFLVYGDSGEISIFSPGTECRKIKYRGFILMPRLSPDGTRYLNVRSDNHTKQSLRLAFVTNVETGADLFALPPAQDPITDIAWSPRGDTLATLEAGTVRVWNADSGRFLFELKPGEVRRMRYTPDGKLIYTTGQDGVLQFWEVSNGTLQCSLRDGLNKVLVAAMSPDGNLLATGGVDGKICVWNVRSLLFKLHILRMPEFWMSVLLATLFFLSVCSDRRLFKNSQRFRVFGVI